MKRYVRSSTLNENSNFTEYYDFVYQNTHLTRDEAFRICKNFWNYDVSKYDAVKMINNGIFEPDTSDYFSNMLKDNGQGD